MSLPVEMTLPVKNPIQVANILLKGKNSYDVANVNKSLSKIKLFDK